MFFIKPKNDRDIAITKNFSNKLSWLEMAPIYWAEIFCGA
jgi:hypothetical protein